MRKIITLIVASVVALSSYADTFRYSFTAQPLAKALSRMADEHPEIEINFIYNELENYKTSANVNTSNPYEALRRVIGLNPVTIIQKGKTFYIEALQHGKYCYTGRAIGTDNEPVIAATVMLLASKDSTVITYGITDDAGRFSIPCDRKGVIAKLTCIGYKPTTLRSESFNIGTIRMEELPIQLNTVKVEAESVTLTPDRNIYLPNSRQKQSAQNAIDLLRSMAIPTLVIEPGSKSVKDVFGNELSIYVNSLPAEDIDIEGMRTIDVKRIEVIDAPTDPRFKGAKRVVNFILAQYEYGGYTKVTIGQTALNGYSNNDAVYSKFSYKKMTYDLYAGVNNSDFRHAGADKKEIYNINPTQIIREEQTNSSRTQENSYPLTLRATFASDKVTVRNTLYYTYETTPIDFSQGMLSLGRNKENVCRYLKSNPGSSNQLSYNGMLFWAINDNTSLNIEPKFSYSKLNKTSDYASDISDDINYAITEDIYTYRFDAYLLRRFGKKHSLQIGGNVGGNVNDVTYNRYDSYSDKFDNFFCSPKIAYTFTNNKLRMNVTTGFGYERIKIGTLAHNDTYPWIWTAFQYQLNRKSQISLSLDYVTSTPGIDMRSGEIIQSNEILYLGGNPNLKNYRNLVGNIAYNYFRNNSFSMTAFGGLSHDFDKVATIYEPIDDGRSLLRTFINSGDYTNLYLGLAANYKLFDNKLQLYANVCANYYQTIGCYNTIYKMPVRVQLQATYYLNKFYFLAYYANGSRTLTENSNIFIRNKSNYGIQAGWGNGKWNLRLSVNNIFRNSWITSSWHQLTPYYSMNAQNYGCSSHANLIFSATYTFGYGKKIQSGNEVGKQSGAASAIIK